jgi:TolB-like protein
VPAPFAAIIARCLEPDRGRRYQHAGEVRAAMTAVRARTAPSLAGRRRSWLTAAAITLLVGTGLVAAKIGDITDRWSGSGSRPVVHSIAVLPLVNLSGDSIAGLLGGWIDRRAHYDAGTSDLSASGCREARSCDTRNTQRSTRDVARALGVDGVLEGSVTRLADRVHITAQLIDAASDTHLWAQSYDRSFDDALALPSELSRAVARETGLPVSSLSPPRAVNPAALDAYLHGHYLWFSPGSGGLQYFLEAVHLQPD